MRRMNLNHANFQPQDLFDVRRNVRRVAGVQSSTGNEAGGIFFGVIAYELIHASSEPDHLGSHVVDEHSPIHPGGIEIFFFNDTATAEIYTLSLHDALLL